MSKGILILQRKYYNSFVRKMVIVSACLLGINTKYNGNSNINEGVIALKDKFILIPVCPEQLGGLTTPRIPAEIQKNGSVHNKNGEDVTENFLRGANETLKLARLFNIKYALLKDGSPSCGVHFIYDGTFSGKKIRSKGVTARLLMNNGIKVFSENDIKEFINETEK